MTASATFSGFGIVRSSARVPRRPLTSFREHYDIGMDLPVAAVGAHADHLAAVVLDQFGDGRLAQDDGAGFLHLARKPFVELGANDGVAVGALLVEVLGAVVQPDMGLVVHHPETLLDQMTLQRRVFPEVRDQLFQHVGVQDRALHVLRAGIFAAFELQHLEAAACEGEGRGIAGHAGADHDGIKFFIEHGGLL